jgi:hypothetical protein
MCQAKPTLNAAEHSVHPVSASLRGANCLILRLGSGQAAGDWRKDTEVMYRENFDSR